MRSRIVNQSMLRRGFSNFLKPKNTWKKPLRVAVTGANGNIGYAAIFRIASGELLGPDQPVILHLLELPHVLDSLKGTVMELEDCAFPLLKDVVVTSDNVQGFKDVDYALFFGSKPRGQGQERADLIKDNANIFVNEGKALAKSAKKTTKALVIGNPANTNALILSHYAPDIPRENITSMSRLDHDRGLGSLAKKYQYEVDDIEHFAVWGNHSPTMFPDTTHLRYKGKEFRPDPAWVEKNFIPEVQKRGATVIAARKSSSAASAANAAIAHVRDWHVGSGNKWVSMGVYSDGSHYNIPKGLFFAFPTTTANGKWKIVEGLTVTAEARKYLDKTVKELEEERDTVKHLLK